VGSKHAVKPSSPARQLDGGGLHEALHQMIDRRADGAAVDEVIGQDTRDERE
jgi:hypothetical protein